jgi:hypothetical protein
MITIEHNRQQGNRVADPHLRTLDSFDALREYIGEKDLGLVPCPIQEVFYTTEWFENLAECGLAPEVMKQTQCRLLVASSVSSGQVVCLPLLYGLNLEGLSNYYSSLFGPIFWGSGTVQSHAQDWFCDQYLWDCIGKFIRREQAVCPVVSFSPMDAQAPFFDRLLAGLKNAGYWVDTFFCFGNWYLDVAGRPFSDYFLTLPAPLRNSIARGKRRLTSAGTWNIQIQEAADGLLEAAIADFVQVYSSSWKGPEPNTRFVPNLARMAAAQGWLRLGVLKLDDKAIAAQFWLVKDGKASIFKLAYVDGVERFSAGSALTSAMMEHVIDVDQVREVDYLTGDDAYKRDWMSRRRERLGIVAFNPMRIMGIWKAFLHFGSWFVKRARIRTIAI